MVMNSYAPDGGITRENIEGRIRQLTLEERRKRGGEIDYRRILELIKAKGVQEKAVVVMADRTAAWLHKAMKVKVWR